MGISVSALHRAIVMMRIKIAHKTKNILLIHFVDFKKQTILFNPKFPSLLHSRCWLSSIQSPPSTLRAAEGHASAKQSYYTTINSLREPGPDGWLAEAAINRIMSGI